ncbi:hypothetical protein ACBY01_09570 [Sphingomonas sp. ac-8]|uniref:hypothetical protein n=1 Tax=Sphingomonas sp. ac-8 TaxID=3242977 RepID=UPI003A805D64
MLPLLLATLLAACDGTPGNGAALDDAVASPGAVPSNTVMPATAPSRPVPPWDASQCGDDEYQNARMERHPALIERSADDLLAAYGKPHAESRFRAGDGVGTYSGGVASQLPGGAAHNARTPVREIIWQRGGCNFVVRFREDQGAWRVFDAFEALADADF